MKRGFTLLEVLLYVLILAVLTGAIIRVLLTSGASISELRSERRIAAAGELALETLIREIRQASDVLGTSSFGVNPGTLSLRTVQSPGSSSVVTRTFSLVSGRLAKQDDSGAPELISAPEVSITNLTFWQQATTSSAIVSVKMTLQSGRDQSLESKTFYGSAILREKY